MSDWNLWGHGFAPSTCAMGQVTNNGRKDTEQEKGYFIFRYLSVCGGVVQKFQ